MRFFHPLGFGAIVLLLAPVLLEGTALAQPTAIPGSYTHVVVVQTIGSSGGTVSASVDGATVTVTVPSGDLTAATQVILTSPDLAGIGDAGHKGYTAVAGVGVLFERQGVPLGAQLTAPATVTVSSSVISSSDLVLGLSSGGSSPLQATVQAGSAQIPVVLSEDIAVLSSSSGQIPGATTSSTGKPLDTEEAAGAALVALGAAALLTQAARRSRRGHRRRARHAQPRRWSRKPSSTRVV